jgi:hypothetical protein
MPAKRRSMKDLLNAQKAIEDGGETAPAAPTPAPAAPTPAVAVLAPQPAAPPPQEPPVPGSFPASAVPVPHSPTGHGQLTGAEEASLAVCEAALDNLRVAFWAAGKALQTVRDARLYRGTHDTFEAYCAERWEISRAQAYRLMSAWPLAERLSPIGDKITESQVRELLAVADNHGRDAAAVIYQAVADSDRVTAALLREVVGILPTDYFDPDEAVQQIRAYLAGDRTPPTPPPSDPVRRFSQADKTMSKLEQDVAAVGVLEAVRAADPELVSRMATRMRAVADQLERGSSA